MDNDLFNKTSDSGIILGFDDYFPEMWQDCFSLFAKYNARVVFYVMLSEPTPFCFEAQKIGHEIAYHTKTHPNLSEVTEEVFFEETLSCINAFRERGIALKTFAYPFGVYKPCMNEKLLQHYCFVRGVGSFSIYDKTDLKNGFVDSLSIDNITYKQDIDFENGITQILQKVKAKNNSVTVLISHAINTNDWAIRKDRLEFILQKCHELGLQFYTYQDFQ